jgi:hypothetical protein
MSKYFLSVAAIFKNEADILGEWIEHYLAEGVDHFYLIENNSSDDWERVLKPYRERGLVTLFIEKGNQAQFKAYNEYILPIRETTWMIVVDLDEFVYAKPGHTIPGYLRKMPSSTGLVQLPWILFGSSGYDRRPEGGLVQNFLWRKYYTGSWALHKSIAKMESLVKMHIHDHEIGYGSIVVTGGMRIFPITHEVGGSGVTEERISQDIIMLNHYQIQNRDRYLRLKTGRGDAVFPDNNRGIDTFLASAKMMGRTKDETLARKRQVRMEAVA